MKKRLLAVAAAFFSSFLAYAQTPWLHTEGNKLKDPAGNIVVLRGVDFQDIGGQKADQTVGLNGLIDMVTDKEDTTGGVKGWDTRVIRFAINPGVTDFEDYYTNTLKPAVDYATSKGVYVIIDNHFIADIQPNIDYTNRFWSFMAPRFRNYPNVIFEIYNEPINSGWSWSEFKPYMQNWINLVRQHAPHNLILAGTPQWCQRMSGAVEEPFTGGNIIYVAHHYPQHWKSPFLVQEIEKTAAVLPVFMSEWGFSMTVSAGAQALLAGTVQNYGEPIMKWADSLGIHWTAWCADDDWEPAMFTRGTWQLKTGNNEMGGFVKQKLHAKKDLNQPADIKCIAPYIGPDQTLCTEFLPLNISSGLSPTDKTIKWYKNDQLISDETGTSITANEKGRYRVTVDSGSCTMSHEINIVDTLFSVSFTKSQVLTDSIVLVAGDGKEKYAYEWSRNGTVISGAKTNSLKVFDTCRTVYKVVISYPGKATCGTKTAEFKALCPREYYLGEPQEIPGVIEAEYYDVQHLPETSNHDVTPGNRGGALRPDEDVDLQNCSEGGYNVFFTDPGEWIEYSIKTSKPGIYDLIFRVASSRTGGAFYLDLNGKTITDSISVPVTGGSQNWTDVIVEGIKIAEKESVLRILFERGRIGFNYIDAVFVKTIQGIKDADNTENTITVYPNPAGNTIYFSGDAEVSDWKILSLIGEELLHGAGRNADISALVPGQYLIVTEGRVSKFVKW